MTRSYASIAKLSATSAKRAQNEAALMQRSLKKLRADISNIGHKQKSQAIATKRTKTQKQTTTSVLGTLASLLASADWLGTDFQDASTGQKASETLSLLLDSQRIR